MIGNKVPPLPWDDPRGAAVIGNLLRHGTYVSISISWPSGDNMDIGTGSHVLNCWGDDRGEKKHDWQQPGHLRVTDCYSNKGGIIQTYPCKEFTWEGKDGVTGKGWYIEYDNDQPFIRHLVLLERINRPEEGTLACLSRITIEQVNQLEARADKLDIEYFTEDPSLSLSANVLFENGRSFPGRIVPVDSLGNKSHYEWNFNRNDLGSGYEYKIIMESCGQWNDWSGLNRGYLSDKQGEAKQNIPVLSYRMTGTETGPKHRSSSATGGYYIISLSFSVFDTLSTTPLGPFEAFLLQQYPLNLNPEGPVLQIIAPANYNLGTLKAGHSYGILSPEQQEEFSSWKIDLEPDHTFNGDTLNIPLNMTGLLPYPLGEFNARRIENK